MFVEVEFIERSADFDQTENRRNRKLRVPKDPAAEQLFLNANGLPLTRFGVRYIGRKYGTSDQVMVSFAWIVLACQQ
jgi:hypothetical protein